MNEELQDVLAQMEPLLAELQDCPAETFATRRRLPNRGVYAFYESDRILYIGRSNQIWKRIRTHGVRGATQEQANFAFRLLAQEYDLARIHRWTRTEGVRTLEGGVRKLQTRWPGLEFG